MAELSDYGDISSIKMMIIGDSGSGKTGALASLAKAGYKLHILDFDKGLAVLYQTLKGTDAVKNIEYESFSDGYKNIGGRIVCTRADAWAKATKTLSDWKPENWDHQHILVLDSLTFAGRAAMNYILFINGRIGQTPFQGDYLEGQRAVENLMALLHSPEITCHLIIISHVRELSKVESKMITSGGKEREVKVPIAGTEKGYPETGTGQALSPTIGRNFNAILLCEITSYGPSARREIITHPHTNIGLKNAAPGVVPNRLPIETGLATYFQLITRKDSTNA